MLAKPVLYFADTSKLDKTCYKECITTDLKITPTYQPAPNSVYSTDLPKLYGVNQRWVLLKNLYYT